MSNNTDNEHNAKDALATIDNGSNGKAKSQKLQKVVEPEKVAEESRTIVGMLPTLKHDYILCQLWNIPKDAKNNIIGRPKAIGKPKKVRYGQTTVIFKDRKYAINYFELKEGTKSFIYDVDERNAIGALNFYDRSERQISPNQTSQMLTDQAVKLFKRNNGISFVLLIALGIAVLGAVIVAGVFAMLYTGAIEAISERDAKITDLNNRLNPQIIIPSTGANK